MEPEVVQVEDIAVISRSVRTNNKNESDQATAKIMPLWMKAFEEGFCTGEQVSYGIYHNYESDHNGDYDVSVAVESGIEDNENMHIESGKYLKFSFFGKVPQVVADGWYFVWDYFNEDKKYKRRYGTDFEKHVPGNKGVDIYISIL